MATTTGTATSRNGRPQSTASLLIRGGRLVDPATGRDGLFDVLVENGKISAVGRGGTLDPAQLQMPGMDGELPVIELPADRPRSSARGDRHASSLPVLRAARLV